MPETTPMPNMTAKIFSQKWYRSTIDLAFGAQPDSSSTAR
jgi:hypothetical protein